MSTLLQMTSSTRIAGTASGLDVVVAGENANSTEIDLSKNKFFFTGQNNGFESRLCFEDLKLSNGRGTSGGAVQAPTHSAS